MYAFLGFFGTFAPKVAQTWFVLYETLHTTLFGTYARNYVSSFNFMRFKGFFGTFAPKAAPTLFVLQETWHTILFSIYYCVEVVGIANPSHMLHNYVLSCDFLRF